MSATTIGINAIIITIINLFFIINLDFLTSKQISKIKIARLLNFRNARKTLADQSILRVLLLCLKRNDVET